MEISADWDTLLVLGGECRRQRPRSTTAVRLYGERLKNSAARAPRIVLTGGKPDKLNGQTEAHQMGQFLLSEGVSPADLFLEQHATNTFENILWGGLLAKQMGAWQLALVSDGFHLRRCRLIFRNLFPELPEPVCIPSGYQGSWGMLHREKLSLAWWSVKLRQLHNSGAMHGLMQMQRKVDC